MAEDSVFQLAIANAKSSGCRAVIALGVESEELAKRAAAALGPQTLVTVATMQGGRVHLSPELKREVVSALVVSLRREENIIVGRVMSLLQRLRIGFGPFYAPL